MGIMPWTANNIVRGGPNDALAYHTLYSSVLDALSEAQSMEPLCKKSGTGINYNLPQKYISYLK
jgi:hypothetical protein